MHRPAYTWTLPHVSPNITEELAAINDHAETVGWQATYSILGFDFKLTLLAVSKSIQSASLIDKY